MKSDLELMLEFPIGCTVVSTDRAAKSIYHIVFKAEHGNEFTILGYDKGCLIGKSNRGTTTLDNYNWRIKDEPT